MKFESVELAIKGYSKKGYGLAQYQSNSDAKLRDVEIAHTIKEDRVLVQLKRKNRRNSKGRLLEVVKPSKDRVVPVCMHASMCGGCTWQQINYQKQLEIKERLIHDLFIPYSNQVQPIIACENPYEYRNKMEFTFSENRAGQKYLGLIIAQSGGYVMNIERCHLVDIWFSNMLNAARSWWEEIKLAAYDLRSNTGVLRHITLRRGIRTHQTMVILTVLQQISKEVEESYIKFVQEIDPSSSIYIRRQTIQKDHPTTEEYIHLEGPSVIFEEMHISIENTVHVFICEISPAAFFQPNTLQAEKLYSQVFSFLKPFKGKKAWDLYCGTGTITMAASKLFSKVLGIELNQDAVENAKRNFLKNNCQNIEIYAADVGKILKEKTFSTPDVIIVDPPRAGLASLTMKQIKELSSKAILYISCNPHTQLENVEEFLESGYEIVSIVPVDQFPHTPHIENIVFLKQKGLQL